MPRVLLTGASGFIAAHILDILLRNGYSVRGTVRSQEKADTISQEHAQFKDQLEFAIVEDIAVPGAFDKAVVSDPPFDAVLHTASPFHFRVTDPESQLLKPAIQGTKGILESVSKYAPSVKRIVITSSFASIIHPERGNWPDKVYSEADWNPITYDEGLRDPPSGYRASKKLAEKTAWDFVAENNVNFDIVTINPPLVLGPIKPYLQSLDSINTSNEVI
jgi:nucleoside-diphosphate-sugar epimerase